MIDYVVKLTEDATRVSPEHHERLRAVGFDDRGILQITLIASLVQLHQPRSRRAGRGALTTERGSRTAITRKGPDHSVG